MAFADTFGVPAKYRRDEGAENFVAFAGTFGVPEKYRPDEGTKNFVGCLDADAEESVEGAGEDARGVRHTGGVGGHG